MKSVILAGGLGSRISEESHLKPKPMLEIGGKPILWHVLKMYSTYGINDFVICCGYKGYVIKEYFANYFLHMSDITFDMNRNKMEVHHKGAEPWKVTVVDTGLDTMTGGRLKRVKEYIEEGTFCMTYGDGLSDINIAKVIEFHRQEKRLATVTAIQPSSRFGSLDIKKNQVIDFEEKPRRHNTWINGGFFVLEPAVLDFVEDDNTIWERKPLEKLSQEGQLSAYKHEGYWMAMDTLRDKNILEELWDQKRAPWKVW